jgi:phosphate transport system substrate-binding protein
VGTRRALLQAGLASLGALGAGALAALPGCGGGADVELTVRGSDSELNLVQRLAEEFMKARPDVSIGVTGGGSGVGIAALLDRTTDIALSSRDLQPQEKLLALRKRVDPRGTIFATDALAVIVHPDNPWDEADLATIGRLFRGEVETWPHGGAVVPYGRQSSSGTYGFFKAAVLHGDYATRVREMNGTAQIVEAVSHDPGGIGYVAAGYLRSRPGVKTLRVVGGDGAAVDPLDEAAVRSGRYPITRPLFQFTDGVPRGAAADFLRFELSPAGERLVAEMGFYPVLDAWRLKNEQLLGEAAS